MSEKRSVKYAVLCDNNGYYSEPQDFYGDPFFNSIEEAIEGVNSLEDDGEENLVIVECRTIKKFRKKVSYEEVGEE